MTKKPKKSPWKYTIEFDRLPTRMGTTLEHPDIAAAGLSIRIERGTDQNRDVAIEAQGHIDALSCCEYELVNGDEKQDSTRFAVTYSGGFKRMMMSSRKALRPDARLIVKCSSAEQDS